MKKALSLACLLISATVAASLPQAQKVELLAFLQKQLAFSSRDLTALEAGQPVVKLPKTAEARDLAAVAAARLDVSPDFFVDRVRDIASFKKSTNVMQLVKFSSPPRLEDLSELSLDDSDIDGLRKCRVQSCDLKLPAHYIDRFRREVNWSQTDARDRATKLMRTMLLDLAQAYLLSGNSALGKYEDKSYVLERAAQLKALLKSTPYTYGYGPEFQKYLEEFPLARPANAAVLEDFMYWSKEDFGAKPVISMTHVTIYRPSLSQAPDVIVSSKGIYASHYLEASVGFTILVRNGHADPPRSYLIYINRSRTDALRGMFGGLKRSLIGGRLRDGAKKNMEKLTERIEAEYRVAQSR